MAANNLRIIYRNLVDLSSTVVTASSSQSALTPASNMKLDSKGKVWRSATAVSGTVSAAILVDFGSSGVQIGGVALPFTNTVSSSATMTVTGYGTGSAQPSFTGSMPSQGITGGTAAYTVTVNACPWNSLGVPDWGGTGLNTYAYGGGTYLRAWFPGNQGTTIRYLSIVITDYSRTATTGYAIEVSRLVAGPVWSPTYNTSFGLTNTLKDLSTSERTESGDLVTRIGPRSNSLSFDLKFLNQADRLNMSKMLWSNGTSRPVLVSLFPDNSSNWELERAHMIYGKLTQLPGLSHFAPDFFSSQIDIEEI